MALLNMLFALALSFPLLVCSTSSGEGGESRWSMMERMNTENQKAFLGLFPNGTGISRRDFPTDFTFGSLTLSCKHEGAATAENKSLSIWDSFAQITTNTLDGTNPDMGGDSYYNYEEDIASLKEMGMDSYRFSIAWTRIFPNGSTDANEAALDHYNRMIDAIVDAGLEPHVTLWAQDHPQELLDNYGGPLNTKFIDDFAMHANTCFSAFGDRVKYWITLDEPNDYAGIAYASSQTPPARCSKGIPNYGVCSAGNSAIEPYIVTHILLLAHAKAVDIYRTYYQDQQKGKIGIALWFIWYEPLFDTAEDYAASRRATDFLVGWYMDPLFHGEYPKAMQEKVGNRLPSFTKEQASMVKGSYDFIGLNMVTSIYATYATGDAVKSTGYWQDWNVSLTGYREGVAIGEGSSNFAVPWSIRKSIEYMMSSYGNPLMYITELGWGIEFSSANETLADTSRINFFRTYFDEIITAITEGANVKGIMTWALKDGFEFFMGLYQRLGLYYVDFSQDGFPRYPRMSALWFSALLNETKSESYIRDGRGILNEENMDMNIQ